MRTTRYGEPSDKEIDALRKKPMCPCGAEVSLYGELCEECENQKAKETKEIHYMSATTNLPSNMKRYFDLTETEKLALTSEQITDAIKIEAIHRGIKIPLPLDNIVENLGCSGFSLPADCKIFHEICVPQPYGDAERSGICFNTPAEARNALEGAIFIAEEFYPVERAKVLAGGFTVIERYVSTFPLTNFATKLQEYADAEPCEEFTKLCEECRDDIQTIRQRIYDTEVRARKKAEYLRLAQDNEEIAMAFWTKAESGPWPQ